MAILVCVAAVLVFQKTIMQPPLKMSANNQYEEAMTKHINTFKEVSSDSLESSFFIILDFAKRLNDNQKIDEDSYLAKTREVVAIYVPRFSRWCFGVFNRSEWPASDLGFMKNKISDLKNLTINGRNIISTDEREKLNEISGILSQYDSARALAASTGFSTVDNARDKINRAQDFATQPYLSNNASLVASLNALPEKLEQAHYKHVLALINKMKNPDMFSESEFEILSDKIQDEINNYENASRQVYHISPNTSHLENLANQYYERGLEHFSSIDDYYYSTPDDNWY